MAEPNPNRRRAGMVRWPSAEQRFWANVRRGGPDECWNWIGKTRGGYGYLRNLKRVMAHRFSWEIHNNTIPEEQCVCHHCDNPGCVNPSHLFLGTHADNMADKRKKGRQSRFPGSANQQAKLNESKVLEIRNAVGTQREIGLSFGISNQLVSRIRRGECWTHL